jgi:predicted branched-subunit amino acid permease
MLPLLVGLSPFGFAIGASAAERDLPAVAGWSTSALIFAGSAQMAAIELIANGATPLVVVATVIVINARLALLSAALAPHWRAASPRWRAAAAAFIVEPLYVLVAERYTRDGSPPRKREYYAGAAAALWFGWVAATALGLAVGGRVPETLALDAVMPIALVCLVVPSLRPRANRVAAIVAASTAALAFSLPHHLGVLAGGLAGVVAASCHGVRR